MVSQLAEALVKEFPEYVEMDNLLRLASKTWPLYGISAMDLSKLDYWTIELLKVRLEF
jgi:hypothetical protein